MLTSDANLIFAAENGVATIDIEVQVENVLPMTHPTFRHSTYNLIPIMARTEQNSLIRIEVWQPYLHQFLQPISPGEIILITKVKFTPRSRPPAPGLLHLDLATTMTSTIRSAQNEDEDDSE